MIFCAAWYLVYILLDLITDVIFKHFRKKEEEHERGSNLAKTKHIYRGGGSIFWNRHPQNQRISERTKLRFCVKSGIEEKIDKTFQI